jgi:hypothetical protein
MLAPLLLAIGLIELHAPNGARVLVNPAEVTSVREPVAADRRHFAPGTRCVVVMTNAQFVAVREQCDAVVALLGDAHPLAAPLPAPP